MLNSLIPARLKQSASCSKHSGVLEGAFTQRTVFFSYIQPPPKKQKFNIGVLIFSLQNHTLQPGKQKGRGLFPRPDPCRGNENQKDPVHSIQFHQFSITLFPACSHDGWDSEKKMGYRVVKDILLYYIVLQDKNNEVSYREADLGSLSQCAMWSRMCNQRKRERWKLRGSNTAPFPQFHPIPLV